MCSLVFRIGFLIQCAILVLDVYNHPNFASCRCNGLMLLETYSSLEGDGVNTRLPSFLNIAKEVTGMPEYSMYNLSLKDEWHETSKFCTNLSGKDLDGARKSSVRVSECNDEWEQKMEHLYDDRDEDGEEEEAKLSEEPSDDDVHYENIDKTYNGGNSPTSPRTTGVESG